MSDLIDGIQKTDAEEIVQLHGEICGLLVSSLAKSIRVGELLFKQKEGAGHGEFLPWIKENLPFTDRTARRYMEFYHYRDLLKTDTVSDLESATKLLGTVKNQIKQDARAERAEAITSAHKADLEDIKANGDTTEKISKAGFEYIETRKKWADGFLRSFECNDPKYLELEKGEVSKELSWTMGQVENSIDCIGWALKRATKEIEKLKGYDVEQVVNAYEVSPFDGVSYLWPEICEAYKETCKLLDEYNKATESLEGKPVVQTARKAGIA